MADEFYEETVNLSENTESLPSFQESVISADLNLPETLQSSSSTIVDTPHVEVLQKFEDGINVDSAPQISSTNNFEEAKIVDNTSQISSINNFEEARIVDNTPQISSTNNFEEVRIVDSTPQISSANNFEEVNVVDNIVKDATGGRITELKPQVSSDTSSVTNYEEAKVVDNNVMAASGGRISELKSQISSGTSSTTNYKEAKVVDNNVMTATGGRITELKPQMSSSTPSLSAIKDAIVDNKVTIDNNIGSKITELGSPTTGPKSLFNDFIDNVGIVSGKDTSLVQQAKYGVLPSCGGEGTGIGLIGSFGGTQAKYGVLPPGGGEGPGIGFIGGIGGTQAKYGVLPAVGEGPEIGFIGGIGGTQAKYGVLPVGGEGPGIGVIGCIGGTQAKYGVLPAGGEGPEIGFIGSFGGTQAKYGVLPAGDEGPGIGVIGSFGGTQAKYGVLCPTSVTTGTGSDTIKIRDLEDMPDTSEIRYTRDLVDGLGSILKDLEKFNENSNYVSGTFGKAMSYSSDICKEDMESLKKFTATNLAHAMDAVGEYDSNIETLKNSIEPVTGSFSMKNFTDDGTYIVPDNVSADLKKEIQKTAGTIYLRNKLIKQKVDLLSEEKIV